MLITTPTAPNAAADMHSMTNANNSIRMKRICIVFPYAESLVFPVLLSCRGLRGLSVEIEPLALYVNLIQYLLNVGNTCGSGLRLLSFCNRFHASLEDQHAILGVVVDVLLVQSIGN